MINCSFYYFWVRKCSNFRGGWVANDSPRYWESAQSRLIEKKNWVKIFYDPLNRPRSFYGMSDKKNGITISQIFAYFQRLTWSSASSLSLPSNFHFSSWNKIDLRQITLVSFWIDTDENTSYLKSIAMTSWWSSIDLIGSVDLEYR